MCKLYLWMDWMWNKRYDAQVTQDGLSMNGLAYIIMFAASLTPTSRIYVHSTAATSKKHCPVGFNCPTPWCRTFWFCLQSLWRRAQLSRSRRMRLKLLKTMKSCKNIMWTCPLYNLILDTIHFTPVTRLSQGLRSPSITSCGRSSWVSTALAAKECAKQIFSEA